MRDLGHRRAKSLVSGLTAICGTRLLSPVRLNSWCRAVIVNSPSLLITALCGKEVLVFAACRDDGLVSRGRHLSV